MEDDIQGDKVLTRGRKMLDLLEHTRSRFDGIKKIGIANAFWLNLGFEFGGP